MSHMVISIYFIVTPWFEQTFFLKPFTFSQTAVVSLVGLKLIANGHINQLCLTLPLCDKDNHTYNPLNVLAKHIGLSIS